MSKTIIEATYYEPIYFSEKTPNDDRCTLMTRHYHKYATDSGKVYTTIKVDATVYDDEKSMVNAIKDGKMIELPEEADGEPFYVPAEFKSSGIRRV